MLWYFLRGLELETSWNQVWPAFPPSSHTMWWSSPPRSWCHLPWFFPDAGDVKFPISMLVLLVQFPQKMPNKNGKSSFSAKNRGDLSNSGVFFCQWLKFCGFYLTNPDPGYHDYNLMEGEGWLENILDPWVVWQIFNTKNTRIYMNCTVSLNEKLGLFEKHYPKNIQSKWQLSSSIFWSIAARLWESLWTSHPTKDLEDGLDVSGRRALLKGRNKSWRQKMTKNFTSNLP